MRILVIPDIHHRIDRADEILKRFGSDVDQVVFLGDYFDEFGDSPEISRRTALWLKERLQDQRGIFLIGNHDLPYFLNKPGGQLMYSCPGFTSDKWHAIREVIGETDVARFQIAWFWQDILCTHAGIHPDHVPENTKTAAELAHYLNAELISLKADPFFSTPLKAVGNPRGGFDHVGGCLWMDWEWEFKPVPGVRQIVGHTPMPTGASRLEQDQNYNLDRIPHLTSFALIEDGSIRVMDK